MKKRRHHHVWRSYLQAWAIDETIFCRQKGTVFSANTRDVAVERDFYKLHELTKNEEAFIRTVIANSPKSLADIHENFITMFTLACRVKDKLQVELAENPELSEYLEQQILNTEEDYHEKLETNVMPMMDALRRRDVSFYKDTELCGQFLHFLSLQYFRTKSLKENIAGIYISNDLNYSKCWNILRHIFAVNVSRGLFLERNTRPFILIENRTCLPFITGDQPVVNLYQSHLSDKEPTMLAFYYPITPWLAIILDEAKESSVYGDKTISVEQVSQLNLKIFEASFLQVYGNSKEILTTLQA